MTKPLRPGNCGSSLLLAIIAVALLSALGLALAVVTSTEMTIAGSYASGQELTYAADAGLEVAQQELRLVSDWNAILGGSRQSTWVDGSPAGPRVLEDGTVLNLGDITSLANLEDRPWGSNNPHWQIFAFSPLNHGYVIVWVGDDPAETDGNPFKDGSDSANPGSGIVALRSEAFGSRGGHQVLEATVGRRGNPGEVVRLSWAQIR